MSDRPDPLSSLTDALILAKRDQVQAALKDVADLLGGFRDSLKAARFTDLGAEALILEFAMAVWSKPRDD